MTHDASLQWGRVVLGAARAAGSPRLTTGLQLGQRQFVAATVNKRMHGLLARPEQLPTCWAENLVLEGRRLTLEPVLIGRLGWNLTDIRPRPGSPSVSDRQIPLGWRHAPPLSITQLIVRLTPEVLLTHLPRPGVADEWPVSNLVGNAVRVKYR